MKKLLISLLCVSTVFCPEPQSVAIVDYNPSHKDAVVEILFQNTEAFGGMSRPMEEFEREFYLQWHKNKIEESFVDPLVIKKVIVDSGKVVAFISFSKERERSLESLKDQINSDQEEEMLVALGVKRTDAECDDIAHVGLLAVSRDFRRRGYGKALINHAITFFRENFPMIKYMDIYVDEANFGARSLYESQGFSLSPVRTSHFINMKTVIYEKDL
jgi:ribosomal protein S18 acetylase RimI-like enzyme